MANRANARTSTGPKTMQGRTRSARNALRHALSLPVYSNLVLCEEVDALAREIAGTDAKPKFESSRAESPKRRSICAACVARAIDSCPRHWAILPMPLRQTCGKNWQSSETFCETRLPTHRSAAAGRRALAAFLANQRLSSKPRHRQNRLFQLKCF